ncbi:MAG: DUF58 domain-containing protein [Candidatus Woesearchaeota archaeon]
MTIDISFLPRLNRLGLLVKKRITSSMAGSRPSIAKGRGLTITDYRPYVKGDDLRFLDWKLYARTDKDYIKLFEEDRSLTVHIILDRSTSMDFGSKDTTKFEYGSMLGLAYVYLTLHNNDKFVFSTFAEDLTFHRPHKGVSQLASIIDSLKEIKVKGESRFEYSMRRYKELIHSRSMVILISDFLINPEEIRKGLMRLGRKNEVKVIQVLDKDEVDLKIEGDVNLHDSESNTVMRTYISKRLRNTYQGKLNQHTQEVAELCNKAGAQFYQVTTDVDIFENFYRIIRT